MPFLRLPRCATRQSRPSFYCRKQRSIGNWLDLNFNGVFFSSWLLLFSVTQSLFWRWGPEFIQRGIELRFFGKSPKVLRVLKELSQFSSTHVQNYFSQCHHYFLIIILTSFQSWCFWTDSFADFLCADSARKKRRRRRRKRLSRSRTCWVTTSSRG